MNYFDIVVGVILIFALVKGFRNGLVIELASLAALILGLLGAIKFSDVTATYLAAHFSSEYMGVVAFLITFVLIVVGVHLLAKAIDKLVSAVALGTVNRLLGTTFSGLKYAFIISVIMAVVESLDRDSKLITPIQKETSFLYTPITSVAPFVFPYLRFEDVKQQVKEATSGVDI